MLFLLPHVAHRRTSTSLPSSQIYQTSEVVETIETLPDESFADVLYFEDTSNSPEVPPTTSSLSASCDSVIQPSTSTTCTNNNSNSSSTTLKSRKITPEPDAFAKRRKVHEQQIERELAEASSAISAAVNSMSVVLSRQQEKENGYMLAIQEGLNHVPNKNKTQCLIEVLQVIQKYEDRD